VLKFTQTAVSVMELNAQLVSQAKNFNSVFASRNVSITANIAAAKFATLATTVTTKIRHLVAHYALLAA
jgi:hypothetical protein